MEKLPIAGLLELLDKLHCTSLYSNTLHNFTLLTLKYINYLTALHFIELDLNELFMIVLYFSALHFNVLDFNYNALYTRLHSKNHSIKYAEGLYL